MKYPFSVRVVLQTSDDRNLDNWIEHELLPTDVLLSLDAHGRPPVLSKGSEATIGIREEQAQRRGLPAQKRLYYRGLSDVSSAEETNFYYAGLGSKPVLVARTSITPELRIEDDLAFQVHAILGEKGLNWTSTNVVRIGYVDESSMQGVLLDHSIDDVEVEIRESKVIHAAGPKLLEPTFDSDPTVDVCEPFTATLGISICAQLVSWAEGTGGFFLDEGEDGKRLLLVTVRHVVFPLNKEDNNLFKHKSDSQHRHNVLVLSDVSLQQHLASITDKIREQDAIIVYQEKRIQRVQGRDDEKANKERKKTQDLWEEAEANVKALAAFQLELSSQWATEESRILGHYIQDVAVINIDSSKIDPSSFAGNVTDLGTKFSPHVLTSMMCPNPKNSHNFEYPGDRLLSLQGTIKDEELRRPTMYDQNDERCIIVLKRGKTGRANNIFSYFILPYDNKSGASSAKGDSNSVIVDGAGRIGGLLTGGAGITDSLDVTYATPIGFVLKTIRANKVLAKAYPRAGPPA
ncbi:hypothetical protein EDD18DRAFT_1384333 [Armillaria luteobubalina]|uniref:Uncharacterized protein n=1 Tax=Armillaria luteobubalina TaxID=153913 RepID=A0AA39Q9H2_9AGAR|nr:hypothetical protein EDD18DRAFT_1384333 [Armillaria luteobubalina]